MIPVLIKVFTTNAIPKVVHSDKSSNFISKLFKEAMKALNISICLSVAFHPESQGALTRFHQALKCMLIKFCTEEYSFLVVSNL